MKRYKNKDGNSGILFYEAGSNFIIISFKGGGTYLYDNVRPGSKHVAKMIELAASGEGLATYINKYIRENYAKKL